MAEINNIIPHEIKAPGLSSANYGENINQQFANINDNFKALGNADFFDGKQGNSISVKYIHINKPIEDNNELDSENGPEYELGCKLYNALHTALKNWTKSLLPFNNINMGATGVSGSGDIADNIIAISELNPLEDLGYGDNIFKWDDGITTEISGDSDKYNYNVPLIVSTDVITGQETYLHSAGSIMFFDARFSAAALNKYQFEEGAYKEHMIDSTCIVNFKYIRHDDETGEWSCDINTCFPRLKYVANNKEDGSSFGSFYWVLNDNESNIKATGIKGDRGFPAKVWIGKCEKYPDDIKGQPVKLSHILINNNWGDAIKTDDMKEGDLIIVYCYNNGYNGFFLSTITSFDSDGSIAVQYIPDANISLINYIENTNEFFKTIGYGSSGSDAAIPTTGPAKGIFLLVSHNSTDNISDNNAHMLYNENFDLYLKPVQHYLGGTSSSSGDGEFEIITGATPSFNIEGYDVTIGKSLTSTGKITGTAGLEINGGANIKNGGITVGGTANITGTITGNNGLNITYGGATISGGKDGHAGLVVTGGVGPTSNPGGAGLVVNGGPAGSGSNSAGIGIKVESGGIVVESGGINVTGDATISGDVNITGKISGSGGIGISNGINITGGATISNGMVVTGSLNIGDHTDHIVIDSSQSAADNKILIRGQVGSTYYLTEIKAQTLNKYKASGAVFVLQDPVFSVDGNGNMIAYGGTFKNNVTVSGQVNASIGFFQTSDERLKNFKDDVVVDLDKLSSIPKKYFTWKSGDTKSLNIGTSAQEIQKLYPELVSKDSEGNLSVAYDKLSIIALKAIDELQLKNKELEERIERLEKLLK